MNGKIIKFVQWLNDTYGENNYKYELGNKGKKYYKILLKNGSSTCVYAFIDIINGDIYMPASWKAPAKHVRGNINNPIECCQKYGIKYLRG